MIPIRAMEARTNLHKFFSQVSESYKPIQIIGKRPNVILISEGDWRFIRKTLKKIPDA
jgi:PHD/YefM family antitoxin component YafN of YafNO toxin-antitoxin module